MIYVFGKDFKNLNIPLEEMLPLLDEERQNKTLRYRFYKDRALCALSYILLRYALKQEYGIEGKPKFIYSEYGKPCICGSDISFSISHCDTAIACIVDRKNVGIDVQNFSSSLKDVKNRFLTKKESAEIEKIENEDDAVKALAQKWSLKEAYGKYKGVGLNYHFSEKDFSEIESDGVWRKKEGLRCMSRTFESFALAVFSESEMDMREVSLLYEHDELLYLHA